MENPVSKEVVNAQLPMSRDKNGRFLPGFVTNPTGRPKLQRISDAYKDILDNEGAEKIAQTIYNDALTAKKPSDRLAAAQEMADRVEGKAVQSHRLSGDMVDGQTARLIAELAGKLITVSIGQVNIDVSNRPLSETERTADIDAVK